MYASIRRAWLRFNRKTGWFLMQIVPQFQLCSLNAHAGPFIACLTETTGQGAVRITC